MMHWQSGMKRLFAFLFRKPRWYRDAEVLANQYDSQIEAECLKWDEEAQARALIATPPAAVPEPFPHELG